MESEEYMNRKSRKQRSCQYTHCYHQCHRNSNKGNNKQNMLLT